MQISSDTCQDDSIEYAAHYASAAPSFVPFKGRSHTVDGSAPTRHPTASFIPAVHQQRLARSTHQAAPVHALNSTCALRPLQREEFLAKLPKVNCHWASAAVYHATFMLLMITISSSAASSIDSISLSHANENLLQCTLQYILLITSIRSSSVSP